MAFEFSIKFGKDKKDTNKGFVYQQAAQADAEDFIYDQGAKLHFGFTDRNKQTLKVLYNEVAEVNSIITYIGQLVSRMPIRHMSGQNEVKNSDVIAKINNPNSLTNKESFIVDNITNFFVYGNCTINSLIPFGFSKKYSELYTLPYDSVFPITEKSIDDMGTIGIGVDNRFNKLTHYNYIVDGYPKRIELTDMIHWKDNNLNKEGLGWFEGESRLMSAVMASENLKFLYETINTILSKRGALGFISYNKKPGEILSVLSDEDRKDAEKRLSSNYGVTKGKQPFAIISTDLRFNKTDSGLSEFLPIEIKADIFKTLCRVLGNVPDQIFSSDASATLDNLKVSEKRIYTGVCIPIANSYYSAIGKYFGLDGINQRIEVITDEIESLQIDKKIEAEANMAWANYYGKLLADGIITKEYYAEQLNLPKPPKNAATI